jgi:hypothetical protein
MLSEAAKFLLRQMLRHIDQVSEAIAAIDERIRELLEPMKQAVEFLRGVPGLDEVSVAGVLAEIGPDMTIFPTAFGPKPALIAIARKLLVALYHILGHQSAATWRWGSRVWRDAYAGRWM